MAETLDGISCLLERTRQPRRVVLGTQRVHLSLQRLGLQGFASGIQLRNVRVEFFKPRPDFLLSRRRRLDRVGRDVSLEDLDGFLRAVAGDEKQQRQE